MVAHSFLITGASSGMGLELAYAALRAGHTVLATARDPKTAATNHPEMEQLGGQWRKLDVSNNDSEYTVHGLIKEHNVDVLVNNAGYAMLGPLEEMSMDEFEGQLQTNTIGTVRCIKAALPIFRGQKRGGTIVNIGSLAGFIGSPACSAYSASKFALEGISESLAKEVGVFGIRVLLIELGAFRTKLVHNLRTPASKISDYDGTPARELVNYQLTTNGKQPGDPVEAAKRIVEIVADGKGDALRVFLGSDCYFVAKAQNKAFNENLELCVAMAKSTDFEKIQ